MDYRIIGCGNSDRGDDSAGLLVARRLRELGIDAQDHDRDGLSLMDCWQGPGVVVLVDAVLTGSPAGTVTVLDGTDAPVIEDFCRCSTHAFGVAEAVKLARVLNRMPDHLIIYGIEGRRFGLGCKLSPEVAAAIESVAARIACDVEGPGGRSGL